MSISDNHYHVRLPVPVEVFELKLDRGQVLRVAKEEEARLVRMSFACVACWHLNDRN
ncbi:hypothetical protein KSC_056920 [Ktedonobacter sp. SOSP1-52]|uniref:hypothetical protein n=1 Tax=Ktedonobacter sp. SOSP1-52 TaxID=2778366 RepID=UPI001A31CD32|nr:hypothetical protein [Ktedonobacter sp. SOSP1-52]GHO66800.1 hypothetical protein KSC_056920 [Ktedonobacter sp. SOSP1-52]